MARFPTTLRALLGATMVCFSLPVPAAQAKTVIVFDGSKSMWGRVDGAAKIEIAREAFADILPDWGRKVPIGVIAYGHGRPVDCTDIEQIVEVGPVDAEAATTRVRAIMPKGRAPLTDAEHQAVKTPRYKDMPATVILPTDGIDTCDQDPCQLTTNLEPAELAFTPHLIDFDVAVADCPQTACSAENTGGRFLAAANAVELNRAMRQVAVEVPAAALYAPIRLVAVTSDTGAALSGAMWRVVAAGDGTQVRDGQGTTLALQLPDGEYQVSARLGDASASQQINVVAEQADTHEQRIDIPLPEATLSAPETAPAGSVVDVEWSGPNDDGDGVVIVAPDTPMGQQFQLRPTGVGNPAKVRAPDALGSHEIRYYSRSLNRILATRPIELTPIAATLEAPDQVLAGGAVEVDWTGPANPQDYITIVERGAQEGAYTTYFEAGRGSPATFQVPDALGDYEVRYVVGQSKRTLASRPISLIPVVAMLEAPAEVPAGGTIDVHWSGPDNRGDYITVVEKGAPEGACTKYADTRKGSPVTVQVPDALGDYEVRYVVGHSKRTLASRPVTLLPVSAALRVDGPVLAGALFEVHWSGPGNKRDYVTIVEPSAPEGSHTSYQDTKRGNPVRIKAPDIPGDYEVRYVVGQSKRTLASLLVKVGTDAVTLEVPGPVDANGVVEVTFSGPGRYEDQIEIVAAGAAADARPLRSARASQGSPLTLFAPPAPGTYDLRYRMTDTGTVLAKVPLTVD